MIKQEIIDALRIIYETLKDKNIKWVLAGSCSLALQGVDVEPSDIDILTDKNGAFEINKLLKEYEIEPVCFGSSEIFSSYFGKFNIRDIKIDLMGNLKEKRDGKWVSLSHRLVNPRVVNFQGMLLPVSSLQDHLESYSKSNNRGERDKEKAEKIKRVLNSISS